MPKLKPSPQKLIGERVVNNIRTYRDKMGYRFDYQIAKRLNMPNSTFSEKMANPRRLKLEDLVMIAQVLKVPIQNLFDERT